MNLSQLKYVIALQQYKSFSLAASHLYITQPSLSQQIKALEDELGVQLFKRTTRTLELTNAGIEFTQYALNILQQVNQLENAMHKYNTKVSGILRIGLLWTFSYLSINELLDKFTTLYPTIQLQITIDSSLKLYELLMLNKLDLIFINSSTQIDTKHYQFIPIEESPCCAIVNNKNPLSLKQTLNANDFINQNILLPDNKTVLYRQINNFLNEYASTINILGYSGQVDTCIHVASSNLAITFLTKNIYDTFNDKNIKAIPLNPSIIRSTGLLVPLSTVEIPINKAFINYMNEFRMNQLKME